MPPDDAKAEKIGMLKAQRVNIWDRLFVYIFIWGSSLYLDTMFMSFGLFQFPWMSMFVIPIVIYKKLKRLVDTSSLQGIDDSDIVEGFDNIIDKMLMKPLLEKLVEMLKGKIK